MSAEQDPTRHVAARGIAKLRITQTPATVKPTRAYGPILRFMVSHLSLSHMHPENFIGFPDYVGQALKRHTSNAACPGETSTAPDDGCRFYRSQAPLQVSYETGFCGLLPQI
jgi:hypothetical protein